MNKEVEILTDEVLAFVGKVFSHTAKRFNRTAEEIVNAVPYR